MNDRGIVYRHYQCEALDAAFAGPAGEKDSSPIMMPTGIGKTVLSGMWVASEIEEAGGKILFLSHRKVLNEQDYKAISYFGIDRVVEIGPVHRPKHPARPRRTSPDSVEYRTVSS